MSEFHIKRISDNIYCDKCLIDYELSEDIDLRCFIINDKHIIKDLKQQNIDTPAFLKAKFDKRVIRGMKPVPF